ncbi:hypothetical protein PanWU01x14_142590, partial [Parasponia andersonii]
MRDGIDTVTYQHSRQTLLIYHRLQIMTPQRDANTTYKPQHRVLNPDYDATTTGKTTTSILQPKFAMPPSAMLTLPDDLDL